MRQTPLPRRATPMRRRSKKMAAIYVQRRKLVAEMLADAMCARCGVAPATEVHEVLTRARGGSILDAANCVPLDSRCHQWVTEHPAAAHAEGWLRNSWEAGTDPDDLLVPCPRCGGQGEVLTAGDTNRDYSTGPCPDCGGSGEGLWLPGDPRRNDEEVA